ncbi:hypothetical protein NADFUDRAFT_44082 [Nadsonia fulvescens var. elongata DSM 6958]|uniref:Flo11 domain-containing protein n=1 Tax=Nadsonia fulvescens var. elongata DSM 6958 TaxID=857566 RepID=A0A1E3PCN2_9ASCO|nr:hypothetical protein NADFUDRAFT_44082 [Nadsonia fulvescens var. elongata DSM 6958]
MVSTKFLASLYTTASLMAVADACHATPYDKCDQSVSFSKGCPPGTIKAIGADQVSGSTWKVTYHVKINTALTNDNLHELKLLTPYQKVLYSSHISPPGKDNSKNWMDFTYVEQVTATLNDGVWCAPSTQFQYDWKKGAANSYHYRTGCDSDAVSPQQCWDAEWVTQRPTAKVQTPTTQANTKTCVKTTKNTAQANTKTCIKTTTPVQANTKTCVKTTTPVQANTKTYYLY